MFKHIKDLWVAALRSGQYAQTTGTLKDDKGYCCLGVLCDLYQRETGKGEWTSFGFQTAIGCASQVVPPKEVLVWSGLQTEAGEIGDDQCLAGDNDNGKTFQEISNTIDSEVDIL